LSLTDMDKRSFLNKTKGRAPRRTHNTTSNRRKRSTGIPREDYNTEVKNSLAVRDTEVEKNIKGHRKTFQGI